MNPSKVFNLGWVNGLNSEIFGYFIGVFIVGTFGSEFLKILVLFEQSEEGTCHKKIWNKQFLNSLGFDAATVLYFEKKYADLKLQVVYVMYQCIHYHSPSQ